MSVAPRLYSISGLIFIRWLQLRTRSKSINPFNNRLINHRKIIFRGGAEGQFPLRRPPRWFLSSYARIHKFPQAFLHVHVNGRNTEVMLCSLTLLYVSSPTAAVCLRPSVHTVDRQQTRQWLHQRAMLADGCNYSPLWLITSALTAV